MNAEAELKAAQAKDAERDQPGMGAALLTVLVMLVSTGILAVLVYIVMITVTPAGSDKPAKGAAVEQLSPSSQPRA